MVLLPAGFHDVLYEDATLQCRVTESLGRSFEGFGYDMTNPPLLEFESTLFVGAGLSLKDQTFRVMDPLSHKMMGLRPDITTQVARVATSRMVDQPKPLRLAYSGPVFRVKSEELHAKRQLYQAGIELVGADNAHADAEIIYVIVNALCKIGVAEICVDFTLPQLTNIVLDQMHVSKDQRQQLLKALDKKDMATIDQVVPDRQDLLHALLQTEISVEQLMALDLPSGAKALCQRLEKVISIVRQQLPAVTISIDPVESLKFQYHTGIGFSVFSKQANEELGRGGRYVIDQDTDAVGCSLYVNQLLGAVPNAKRKERVFIPFGINLHEVSPFHEEGYVVITGLDQVDDVKGEAKRMRCDFVLVEGKLVDVQ